MNYKVSYYAEIFLNIFNCEIVGRVSWCKNKSWDVFIVPPTHTSQTESSQINFPSRYLSCTLSHHSSALRANASLHSSGRPTTCQWVCVFKCLPHYFIYCIFVARPFSSTTCRIERVTRTLYFNIFVFYCYHMRAFNILY